MTVLKTERVWSGSRVGSTRRPRLGRGSELISEGGTELGKASPDTGHSVPPGSPHHSDSSHIQYISGDRKSLVRGAPSPEPLRRWSLPCLKPGGSSTTLPGFLSQDNPKWSTLSLRAGPVSGCRPRRLTLIGGRKCLCHSLPAPASGLQLVLERLFLSPLLPGSEASHRHPRACRADPG